MTDVRVTRWIVCIGGFNQSEGRLTGVANIEAALHRRCNCPTTRVLLKSWRDSSHDLAERIWNWRPSHGRPQVFILGYSYGGYSAVLLARELKERGIDVETMLLVDPVWRIWGRFPSLSSLLSKWKIHVPDNVARLYSWRQEIDKPMGHPLVTAGSTRHIEKMVERSHSYMDDYEEIQTIALSTACPEMVEK